MTLIDPVRAVGDVPITALIGATPLERSISDLLVFAGCQGLDPGNRVRVHGRSQAPAPPVLAAARLPFREWLDQVLGTLSLRLELAATPAGLEVRLCEEHPVEPDLEVDEGRLDIDDVRARATAPPRPHIASSTRHGIRSWLGGPGLPGAVHLEADPDDGWARRHGALEAELGRALEIRASGELPQAAMGTVLRLDGRAVLGRTRWRCTRVTHRIRGERCATDLTATDASRGWLAHRAPSIEPAVLEARIEDLPTATGLIPVALPDDTRAPVPVPAWDDGAGPGHGAAAPRHPGDRVLLLVNEPTSVELMGALPPKGERPSPPASGWHIDDPHTGAWSGLRLSLAEQPPDRGPAGDPTPDRPSRSHPGDDHS